MISNIQPTQNIIKAYKVQSKRISKVNKRNPVKQFTQKDKVEISNKGRASLMNELSSTVQRLTGALDSISNANIY